MKGRKRRHLRTLGLKLFDLFALFYAASPSYAVTLITVRPRSFLYVACAAATATATATISCSLFLDTDGLSDDPSADSGAPTSGDGSVINDANALGDSLTTLTQDTGPTTPCPSDLSSDQLHCGACNHNCLGGACAQGRCQPTSIASGQGEPVGIATDGVELFWSLINTGEVKAMPLGGGAIRLVVKLPGAAHMELRGPDLFVAGYDAKKIYQTPKAGGSATPIATCLASCLGIALSDDGKVYFTDRRNPDEGVFEVLPDGGGALLGSGYSYVEDAVILGNQLLVAGEGSNAIFSVPRAGGSGPGELFQSGNDLVAVAADAKEVWYVSQKPGKIYRRAITGATVPEMMADKQDIPAGITVTEAAIYWANSGNGTIMRLAR